MTQEQLLHGENAPNVKGKRKMGTHQCCVFWEIPYTLGKYFSFFFLPPPQISLRPTHIHLLGKAREAAVVWAAKDAPGARLTRPLSVTRSPGAPRPRSSHLAHILIQGEREEMMILFFGDESSRRGKVKEKKPQATRGRKK